MCDQEYLYTPFHTRTCSYDFYFFSLYVKKLKATGGEILIFFFISLHYTSHYIFHPTDTSIIQFFFVFFVFYIYTFHSLCSFLIDSTTMKEIHFSLYLFISHRTTMKEAEDVAWMEWIGSAPMYISNKKKKKHTHTHTHIIYIYT